MHCNFFLKCFSPFLPSLECPIILIAILIKFSCPFTRVCSSPKHAISVTGSYYNAVHKLSLHRHEKTQNVMLNKQNDSDSPAGVTGAQ